MNLALVFGISAPRDFQNGNGGWMTKRRAEKMLSSHDRPAGTLQPLQPPDLLRAWKIKPDVGNMRNNRPDLIDPIE